MKHVLWGLVPDEAMILIIVGVALLSMFGLMRGKIVSTLVGLVVIPILVAPYFESLFASLPLWVSLTTLVVYGLLVVGALMQIFLGKETANQVMSSLVTAGILGSLKLIVVRPFKMIFRLGRGSPLKRF